MNRPRVAIGVAGILFAVLAGGPGASVAGDGKTVSQAERNHDRARIMREDATAAARSRLGYPSVYGTIHPTDPDAYYALSLQIERLAGMIHALRQAEAHQREMGPPAQSAAIAAPPVTAPLTDVNAVYGPAGPTEKSVRLLLEYRLLLAGNPRLKIGKIIEDDTRILAQVVTVDGSLVEEYAVDRKTGVWQPVR